MEDVDANQPERRAFLKQMVRWAGMAMVSSLWPLSGCSHAREENLSSHASPFQNMSIEDIAGKKLHHGKDQFINPFGGREKGGFFRFLKWKFFSENRFKDQYSQEPMAPVSIDWSPIRDYRGVSITFINHSCVLIRDHGTGILVDPVFFGLGFGFKDFTPLRFDVQDMLVPEHVLVTHGHYDHMDAKSLSALPSSTHMITPLGYNGVFSSIDRNNRTQLDWFDLFEDSGTQIILLPCNHWTMRNPLVGPNRSLWGSFFIRTRSGLTVYVSGDTGYFEGLKELGNRFSVDVAIFCLGAYEPRWFMQPYHLNPRETLQAFRDLRARDMMLVHWGTFRLGDEPVHVPPLEMRRVMEEAGMAHRLLEVRHGQTLYL